MKDQLVWSLGFPSLVSLMVSVDVKHHVYWSMDISYCSSQACIICAMALEGRHQHRREGTNEHVGDSLVPSSPPKRMRAHKTEGVGGGGGGGGE